MKASVEVEGLSDIKRELERTNRTAAKLLRDAVWQAAQVIRNHAVLSISKGGRSGRIYKRGAKVHQASAPGEYPKSDTNNLVRLIHMRRVTESDGPAVDIESNASYSEPLELKAPERGGRPFLSRAFNEKYAEAIAVIEQALGAVMGGDRTARRE